MVRERGRGQRHGKREEGIKESELRRERRSKYVLSDLDKEILEGFYKYYNSRAGGKGDRRPGMMQHLARLDPEFGMQKSVGHSFTSYMRIITLFFSSVIRIKIAGNSTTAQRVTTMKSNPQVVLSKTQIDNLVRNRRKSKNMNLNDALDLFDKMLVMKPPISILSFNHSTVKFCC
ncbi:hypothetical protein CKAN_00136600 [Cinnamomum micranthum f. kanehirae]|uniref:Uncharacterized protein n=1 Tax=Cinnamomum micranthum f. kanehirae TaxID=337451 RepID=A0A3S3M4I3_9MAGN|nr:hypothetical protein CKAN_00136600 [Cinnamomum micranthum f. kanehirae]